MGLTSSLVQTQWFESLIKIQWNWHVGVFMQICSPSSNALNLVCSTIQENDQDELLQMFIWVKRQWARDKKATNIHKRGQ